MDLEPDRRRRCARSHGLIALGFEPGHTASILSNTVVEWVLADLGVLCAGGVSNGIYPTDSASQVHYLCDRLSTRVLFVEDEEQLDKALEVRDQLPLLRKIVVFDMEGLRDFQDPQVISWRRCASWAVRTTRRTRASASSARASRSPTTWPSWSTPRAPPASPRARCTCTAR
jgi:long-subunit acyl-CoA synthetase (AMP-forming)